MDPDEDEKLVIDHLENLRFGSALDRIKLWDSQKRSTRCWFILPEAVRVGDGYLLKTSGSWMDETESAFKGFVDELSKDLSRKEALMLFMTSLGYATTGTMFAICMRRISRTIQHTVRFPTASLMWVFEDLGQQFCQGKCPAEDVLKRTDTWDPNIDWEVYRVVTKYHPFLEFLQMVQKHQMTIELSAQERLRLATSLIRPLMKTFGLINLVPPKKAVEEDTIVQRKIASELIKHCSILYNPVQLLYVADDIILKDKCEQVDAYPLHISSFAVFAYLTFCVSDGHYPQVYSRRTLVELSLRYVLLLLASNVGLHHLKGTELLRFTLENLGDIQIEDYFELEVKRLLKILLTLMLESFSIKARREAMNIWWDLLEPCRSEFKVQLIEAIYDETDAPVLKGFLTDQWRKLVVNGDANAYDLLHKVVFIPEYNEVQILEDSEIILANLSLIYYMILTLKTKNSYIEEYLSALKSCLGSARMQWQISMDLPQPPTEDPNLAPNFEQTMMRLDHIGWRLDEVQKGYDELDKAISL